MRLQKLLIAQPDRAYIYGSSDELEALHTAIRMHLKIENMWSVYVREKEPERVELRDFFYNSEINEANKVLKLAYAMGLNVKVETWVIDQK